jgi:hypothetical protein
VTVVPANVCGREPSSHEEDLTQQAVLAVLLDAHPAQRSIEEIVRELVEDPAEFGERDRVENAVRDLVGAGLLHRHGPFVFATHAAVRLNELAT